MSGVRQQKYGRLIQKELSDIFFKGKSSLLNGQFVTIAEVKMSPDLGLAKVYLSMSLVKDKKALLGTLMVKKSEIRKDLGLRIRNQARIVPELQFYLDEVEENALRMEELLKSLNIPKEDQ